MRSSLLPFLLLLSCQARHEETPNIPQPLAVLPGTGIVPIAMEGDWRVDEIEVLQEASNATLPPPDPAGFMPPVLGASLVVSGNVAIQAGGHYLSIGVCGVGGSGDAGTVSDLVNHVDGRQVVFSRYIAQASQPGLADSGGSELLQFSLGSVDPDTMSGLVHHQLVTAFPPINRPLGGLYRVTLRRIVVAPAVPTIR